MNTDEEVTMRIAGSSLIVSLVFALGCVQLSPQPAPEEGALSQAVKGGSCTFCGGIAGIPCPQGQQCKLAGDFPDAGGCCIGAAKECTTDKDCFHTGCSGQLCAAEDIITTCEFKCEYGCYAATPCGCVGGQCRFQHGQALAQCLNGCKPNGGGGGGEACGDVVCPKDQVCCNPLLSICTPPGGVCIL